MAERSPTLRRSVRRRLRSARRTTSSVNDPPPGENILDQSQQQDNREQNERQRGAVPIPIGLIELLKDQDTGGCGCVGGSTFGHDPDVVERFEGTDDGEDQQEKRCGRQQRQRDLSEENPAASAIHFRGVVQLARDVAQTRQKYGDV